MSARLGARCRLARWDGLLRRRSAAWCARDLRFAIALCFCHRSCFLDALGRFFGLFAALDDLGLYYGVGRRRRLRDDVVGWRRVRILPRVGGGSLTLEQRPRVDAQHALPVAIEPEQTFALAEAQRLDHAGESIAPLVECLVHAADDLLHLAEIQRPPRHHPRADEDVVDRAVAVELLACRRRRGGRLKVLARAPGARPRPAPRSPHRQWQAPVRDRRPPARAARRRPRVSRRSTSRHRGSPASKAGPAPPAAPRRCSDRIPLSVT